MPPGRARHRLLDHASLRFKRLHPDEIDTYIACGERQGKAGGYADSGPCGAALIRALQGSPSGVVGLPCSRRAHCLSRPGYWK